MRGISLAVDRDRLLEPTLANYRDPRGAELPWSFNRLAYPAFFGGPLAFGVLGALNARRLGLPKREAYQVVGWGLLFEGLLIAAVVAGYFVGFAFLTFGYAAHWCSRGVLETPDRVHHYFGDGEDSYADLADAAVLATIAARLFEIVLIAGFIK